MSEKSSTLVARPTEPQPGEVLADKYELRRVIGRGGFGLVYDALHLGIGRQIALKVLLPQWANKDPELAIRFRREAVLASQLRHPNTITLYNYGQTSSNILYMAMEFVDGRTLSSVLRDEAPVEPQRVVHILKQILASLQEAHDRGIIHRDLKPGNIMLTSHRGDNEFVKVLDFGIAKAISPDLLGGDQVSQTLTQAGQFCGTPRYMAPEQFRNGDITPACDLYSVGLISFEMLTGQPAVVGETMVDLIVQQVAGPSLTLPDSLALPIGLRHALHRSLRKDPAERFNNAATFLTSLDGWNSDAPVFDDDDDMPTRLEDSMDQTIDAAGGLYSNGLVDLSNPPDLTDLPTYALPPVTDDEFPDPFAEPIIQRSPPVPLEDLEDTHDFEENFEENSQKTSPADFRDLNIFGLDDELTTPGQLDLTDDDPITEEIPPTKTKDPENTTTELARSAVVGTNSDLEPTIDISRRELFDGDLVPEPPPGLKARPKRVPKKDVDATMDMPLNYHLVEQDLEHARRARMSARVRDRHQDPSEGAGGQDTGRSPQRMRLVYIIGTLFVLVFGGILVVQTTRYAWDNGLATKLGRKPEVTTPAFPGARTISLDAKTTNTITITITSKPNDARVFVDDKELGRTPVSLTAAKGKNARLRVKLDDHIGYATELKFRRDRILEVKLTPTK